MPDLSNFYLYQLDTHSYVLINQLNQIRQICSAQGLAQQTMLVVMKSLLVEHMMTELA